MHQVLNIHYALYIQHVLNIHQVLYIQQALNIHYILYIQNVLKITSTKGLPVFPHDSNG